MNTLAVCWALTSLGYVDTAEQARFEALAAEISILSAAEVAERLDGSIVAFRELWSDHPTDAVEPWPEGWPGMESEAMFVLRRAAELSDASLALRLREWGEACTRPATWMVGLTALDALWRCGEPPEYFQGLVQRHEESPYVALQAMRVLGRVPDVALNAWLDQVAHTAVSKQSCVMSEMCTASSPFASGVLVRRSSFPSLSVPASLFRPLLLSSSHYCRSLRLFLALLSVW